MTVALDHLVVLAADLPSGIAWVEERLGVGPDGGGKHPGMGTRNALWRLGAVYLEAIAPDPEQPRPAVPRWFGLDDPGVAARLASDGPFLGAWAVAADDLAGFAAASPVPMRDPEPCRRGDLAWEVVRAEGAAPALGGLWPLGIRWPEGVHPVRALPDRGLSLDALELGGEGAQPVAAALGPVAGPVAPRFAADAGPARVVATIALPGGGKAVL